MSRIELLERRSAASSRASSPPWTDPPRRKSTSVGPVVARVDLDELPVVEPDVPEGLLAQLAHRVRLAGADDEVVALRLLEHEPHRLDVVLRVAPVAAGLEVAEVELLLQPELDARGGARDLARDERLAAPRATRG